jgi:hypothetical protein
MATFTEWMRLGEARMTPLATLALGAAMAWIAPQGAEAAAATAERTVSGVRISLGEEGRRWTLVPTMLDGKVESFLALREDLAYGENLTAVWYRKSTSADGTESWETKAFEDQDQSKAIRAVKNALALADATDGSWPAPVAPVAAAAPESLVKGVLETDALAPLVADLDDPQPLVEMLEGAGWKAAWIGPLEGAAVATAEPDVIACPKTAVLAALARGVESGSVSVGEAVAFAYLQLSCIPTLCVPWTWDDRVQVPWGPWLCVSPWRLLWESGWAPTPIGPCAAKAWYERTLTRWKTFTVSHRSLSCVVTTWNESVSQTETQRASCTYQYEEADCDFGRATPPTGPCTQCAERCEPGICGL